MVFSSTHLWRGPLAPGSWVPVSFEHLHECYLFPGVFPFFKNLMTLVSVRGSISTGWGWGEYSVLGRFSSSWKCCAHLATCCLSVSKAFPFLSFTGYRTERLGYEPHSCFEIVNTLYICPFRTALSASLPFSCTKALLLFRPALYFPL